MSESEKKKPTARAKRGESDAATKGAKKKRAPRKAAKKSSAKKTTAKKATAKKAAATKSASPPKKKKPSDKLTVVITGISGTLARGVARRLIAHGHEVHGIDRRPWPDAPDAVHMHRADIGKRPAEDVFRVAKPDVLVHMATVTHFTTGFEERYRINLGGTRKLFEHCAEYGVKQAIFVGRHTVYGATAGSPLYHTEDEPPLGGASFRELADLVAADLYAGSALWRWPKMRTAVLRLCYFLGPSRRGTLANFLGDNRVPLVMGFDPLYQFMHEFDAEDAIRLAIEKRLRGVYNVAGPTPVPLSILCKATGRTPIRIPEPFYGSMLGRRRALVPPGRRDRSHQIPDRRQREPLP